MRNENDRDRTTKQNKIVDCLILLVFFLFGEVIDFESDIEQNLAF